MCVQSSVWVNRICSFPEFCVCRVLCVQSSVCAGPVPSPECPQLCVSPALCPVPCIPSSVFTPPLPQKCHSQLPPSWELWQPAVSHLTGCPRPGTACSTDDFFMRRVPARLAPLTRSHNGKQILPSAHCLILLVSEEKSAPCPSDNTQVTLVLDREGLEGNLGMCPEGLLKQGKLLSHFQPGERAEHRDLSNLQEVTNSCGSDRRRCKSSPG